MCCIMCQRGEATGPYSFVGMHYLTLCLGASVFDFIFMLIDAIWRLIGGGWTTFLIVVTCLIFFFALSAALGVLGCRFHNSHVKGLTR